MVSTPASRRNALAAESQRVRCAQLRLYLALGSALTIAAAALLGSPLASVAADPDLARLLRGMALIKALIVTIALLLLRWRFGQPLSSRLAAAYLAGVWLMAGASMMIWQLAEIPTAAFSFHLGAFVLLATAWRDRAC